MTLMRKRKYAQAQAARLQHQAQVQQALAHWVAVTHARAEELTLIGLPEAAQILHGQARLLEAHYRNLALTN